jgi:tight adherence protein B
MTVFLPVGILIAIATLILLYGLGQSMVPRDEIDERLEEWVQGERQAGRGDEAQSLLKRVDRSVQRQGYGASMREDLAQADLALTVTEYIAIRVLILMVFVVVGYFIQRSLVTAALLGALGFVLPIIYVRTRQRRRLRSFNGQLPDVLDHLVGSLRAGYGLLQAVEWVSNQIPNPAGQEFDRIIREVQLGRSLMDSLDSMVRRIPSDDLALIVTGIKIQYEVGGRLADVLEIVAHTIRERVRIEREINVLTAQQRYSGYVLMILPIALGAFLMFLNPEYEMRLFTPGPTLCIPVGAGLMMIVGFFVMRRIVDIEV